MFRSGQITLPVIALVAILLAMPSAGGADGQRAESCAAPGHWLDPKTGESIAAPDLFARLAKRRVVLLGEVHTDAEHHGWQQETLAGLRARHGAIVLALEMFPRAAQAPLDAWVGGDLSRDAFLEATNWDEVWGYDAKLYMPIFQTARRNGLPMRGVNVSRQLISRVGREGWDAVPETDREGLTRPAPPTEAYRKSLAEIFLQKMTMGIAHSAPPKDGENPLSESKPTLENVLEMPGFQRFVAAQLVWDRAMAEGIAAALRDSPDGLVVGIIGRGHIENGWGVPRQLADLGITGVASLLPVTTGDACEALEPDIAEAVFVLPRPANDTAAAPWKPRLGVRIEAASDGARVKHVQPESVAAAAGLRVGDVILSAAGAKVAETRDLIAIVGRQAPGTWLPLAIQRGDAALPIIAKFPTTSATE